MFNRTFSSQFDSEITVTAAIRPMNGGGRSAAENLSI